jgi:hypothetical protein
MATAELLAAIPIIRHAYVEFRALTAAALFMHPASHWFHVREGRQSDAAYPGPRQHRGNVEVLDRESLADQVTGCRPSLIVDSGFCN